MQEIQMRKPKQIITTEMLSNMEMLAVTNPAMRDILDQAKVIYELAGAPQYFDPIPEPVQYGTDDQYDTIEDTYGEQEMDADIEELYKDGMISRDYLLKWHGLK
jgi:hypothetical protein